MNRSLVGLLVISMAACNKPPSSEEPQLKMSDFERSLVTPLLEQIRAGVVPMDERSIGICEGVGKDCTNFLGNDVGLLNPGKYMVKADLKVPDVGPRGTWKVKFDVTCEITSTKTGKPVKSNQNYSKTYEVTYVGIDRGYRLSPLRIIESPMTGGAAECKYLLTTLHPDGDKTYAGSWSVPEAPQKPLEMKMQVAP